MIEVSPTCVPPSHACRQPKSEAIGAVCLLQGLGTALVPEARPQ